MVSLSQMLQNVNTSNYKLDLSGAVGLFGGDSAVLALQTLHLYEGRRWAGWYNYPGTVTVARKFGQMANSRVWDSVFPGPNEPPTTTFALAGMPGPEYNGTFSGTKMETRYLGYLMAKECADCRPQELKLRKTDGEPARKTGTCIVTVMKLPQRHAADGSTSKLQTSVVPSLISILACIACLLVHDPICASLILLGIVSSGISSIAFGTAKLSFQIPVPSKNSPPGDGLMFPKSELIILKGDEADVNVADPDHYTVGVCSLLLMTQFLAQLLLIPASTVFGQITYLVSFIASGCYHLYVASDEKEKVQRGLLCKELDVVMEKWSFGTRTQMAVFACLVLGEGRPHPREFDPCEILMRIIPNQTPVWKYWRKKVVDELRLPDESPAETTDRENPMFSNAIGDGVTSHHGTVAGGAGSEARAGFRGCPGVSIYHTISAQTTW
ncbi:hypothetical protein BU15DRAFT_90025 [Melanogaster broomeanus]|nr:hypothetical protein BU15DRAFT_90025 [Melanogaster broomeanus]